MPDGLNTYKSTLTGPELDEALRNIGNVQANIEKAAGYAETAEQYGTIVKQNQAAIQAIEDNLPAVQGAAANAQSAAANAQAAAQSAQEAQTAAQQALGFRTFFSAVSPDENGDLDPSRPMTTPTAQESWTIKSKGDRIQSVQVNGFTTQSGSGDPSPTNVRPISTAGMRMVKVVLTGSEAIIQYLNGIAIQKLFQGNLNNPKAFCTDLAQGPTGLKNQGTFWFGYNDNFVYCFLYPTTYKATAEDVTAFKQLLQNRHAAGNPITFWYVPADESQATGLYIPVETQGHEYRCQCLELTAPLCDGDKVESCVPSGCDKTLTIDGSTVTVTASGADYVVAPADAADDGNVYAEGLAYLSLSGGQIVISASSFPASVTSAQMANTWLQSNPQKVWYQSTAYTEANDIPVELETHQQEVLVLNGTEPLLSASTVESLGYYCFLNLANANTGGIQKVAICSHLKNSKTPFFAGEADNHVNQFCIGDANTPRFMFSHSVLGTSASSSAKDCMRAVKSYLSAQYAAGTPVTIVYKLSAPAVYAHDPVELISVPYTEADSTAAQQLANTPSTLPYIDSADVPMLLDSIGMPEPDVTVQSDGTLDAENTQKAAEWVQETAQRLMAAPLASAPPVAGTYVVSSQDGTTVLVSLKAMQDGGDAATLGGMTLDDIKALISSMIADANK